MESRELRNLEESRELEVETQTFSSGDVLRFWDTQDSAKLNPAKLPNPKSKIPCTRVILVRHGRSTFNQQGRYQGSSDEAVLIEKGRLDAGRVGDALKGIHIDAVYASP
ncbi:MAG: histidine phosphatase family protein, partial [Pseudanabaenales cyanobacterium]|nr:histidine phosphatase family protein [Pseudanabaenales cyanobacterium]